jgi:hypothetical protein
VNFVTGFSVNYSPQFLRLIVSLSRPRPLLCSDQYQSTYLAVDDHVVTPCGCLISEVSADGYIQERGGAYLRSALRCPSLHLSLRLCVG